MPGVRLAAISLGLALAGGCLGPVVEPPRPAYHNPLDVYDAGPLPGDGGGAPGTDGGLPPGATVSQGSVDGRAFELTSAIYQVQGGADGGMPRTLVSLSDAPDLCGALTDGGLPTPWNVVRLYLAGDVPGFYPVAPVLPPSGATATFDWEDGDGGGFGWQTGQDGGVQLDRVDPGNAQTTAGSYAVDFGDAGALVGRFTASPCAALPPPPGE